MLAPFGWFLGKAGSMIGSATSLGTLALQLHAERRMIRDLKEIKAEIAEIRSDLDEILILVRAKRASRTRQGREQG